MYKQGKPNLRTGRLDSGTDSKKLRHFQTVTSEDLSKLEESSTSLGVGILGYVAGKGVALSKGRIGVKEGPDTTKQALVGPPDLNQCEALADYGNVYHNHEELIDIQKELATLAAKSIVSRRQASLLGGGHDIAYAQYLATHKVYPIQSIGVINTDAHSDTRVEQQSTSGASFRQILEGDENIGCLVFGIAQGGNTQSLFDYVKEKKIDYVFADELLSYISPIIKDMIERLIHEYDVIMFTICMDVIDNAFAPGVNTPAVSDPYPHTVPELAERIILSDKVSSVSIVEMNPTYDADNKTVELATNLVHRFLK